MSSEKRTTRSATRSASLSPKSTHKVFSTPAPDLRKDLGDFCLLVFLYMLQGVPLGLSFGSIPYLLKSKLSYSDIALFSLSSYPYSLKLLWSPIVDSLYVRSFGRRKSWIVPIQAIAGLTLIYMGAHIDALLDLDKVPVTRVALAFTILVLLCATQDIAVDGWALTLLREENKTYASTAQTIGLNTGYFLSFTVFLALNSPEFCNKYILSVPRVLGVVQLGAYLQFWGIMFLVCDAWLLLFKREEPESAGVAEGPSEVSSVYKIIWTVCKTPHMRRFIYILMLAKIGFICNEAVTGLKLLELGFSKEDLALAVLIDFPFQILFGYYAAKWSSGPNPLRPWLYAFYGRLAFALIGMLVVRSFPADGVTSSYFIIVMSSTVLASFMSTVQFVSMGSFFTKISDPLIGGTYMTLLNTISNLGGTWPKYFVLEAVDHFTVSACSVPLIDGSELACLDEATKAACKALNGTCIISSDGYYTVGSLSFVAGLVILVLVVVPGIRYIEGLNDQIWRLQKEEGKDT